MPVADANLPAGTGRQYRSEPGRRDGSRSHNAPSIPSSVEDRDESFVADHAMVFPSDLDVAIDSNHLERKVRPISMGW